MSDSLAVESSVTEVPRRVVQRRTEQLDEVDLNDFFLLRLPAEELPSFSKIEIAGELRRGICRETPSEVGWVMSWASRGRGIGLVPAMLLHRPRCAGSIGRDELARRADQFAAGRWQSSSIRFDKPQQESPG